MTHPTVPIQDWVDEITVACPGVSQGGANQAVHSTVREFCTESGAWVRQLAAMNIKAGKEVYYTDPQPDAAVLYVHSMMYVADDSSKWIPPVQAPQNLALHSTPATGPTAFYGVDGTPGAFSLLPVSDVDQDKALRPYVALTIKDSNCDTVPYHFKSLFYDILLDGAMGRLCMQQDKPYSNMVLSQYHLRRFRNGIAKARDISRRQYTNAESRFVFPAWA